MARGRLWTPEEDAQIRRIAGSDPGYLDRIRQLADEFGRTPEAVRRRAQRIGVHRQQSNPIEEKTPPVPRAPAPPPPQPVEEPISDPVPDGEIVYWNEFDTMV